MVVGIRTGKRYSFRTNFLKKKKKKKKKKKNCLIEVKFGTQTYSNMPNLMAMFTSCFKPKNPF